MRLSKKSKNVSKDQESLKYLKQGTRRETDPHPTTRKYTSAKARSQLLETLSHRGPGNRCLSIGIIISHLRNLILETLKLAQV